MRAKGAILAQIARFEGMAGVEARFQSVLSPASTVDAPFKIVLSRAATVEDLFNCLKKARRRWKLLSESF